MSNSFLILSASFARTYEFLSNEDTKDTLLRIVALATNLGALRAVRDAGLPENNRKPYQANSIMARFITISIAFRSKKVYI